jgi:hypothetical protein
MLMQLVIGVQTDQRDAQWSIFDQRSPYPSLYLRQLFPHTLHLVGKGEGECRARDLALDW